MVKKIAVGADHGGYRLKEKIKKYLAKKGFIVTDAGCRSAGPCDYPVFGARAAKLVSDKKAQKAVLVCKSGIGMSMVANKLPLVRAALCVSVRDAVMSRKHNDTNVLVLAAAKTGVKKSLRILVAWLRTRSLGGRHARRVRQIASIEKKIFRRKRWNT